MGFVKPWAHFPFPRKKKPFVPGLHLRSQRKVFGESFVFSPPPVWGEWSQKPCFEESPHFLGCRGKVWVERCKSKAKAKAKIPLHNIDKSVRFVGCCDTDTVDQKFLAWWSKATRAFLKKYQLLGFENDRKIKLNLLECPRSTPKLVYASLRPALQSYGSQKSPL